MKDTARKAIADRTARVGVIGLGYVGLPLVKAFGDAEFPVCGFDIDARKISRLERGESYIDRVSSEWISEKLESGRLRVTGSFEELREMDAVLICVPTPLTRAREPDLSYVRSTAEEIGRHLQPGQLIVLESTTYPGTTREVLKPILDRAAAGSEYFLAFSPEREDPGNPNFATSSIPKLVGGVDRASGELAAALYDCAVREVLLVSSAEVAEAAKILENVYRAVNIALVNELKMLLDRMKIDVWEVIEAASTKPFGFQAFYPGPGLGGHCIPIDPFYLTWKMREFDMSTRFVELAGEVNIQMPHFVVGKLVEALNRERKTVNGSQGLILGISYKPNIDDVRESPAFRIMELLQAGGAELSYHDPYVAELPPMRNYQVEARSVPLTQEVLASHDFAVIVTNHDVIDWDFVVEHAPLIVDTRNATRHVKLGREKIIKA